MLQKATQPVPKAFSRERIVILYADKINVIVFAEPLF